MFDSVINQNQRLPYIPPPDYTLRYKPPLASRVPPVTRPAPKDSAVPRRHQPKDDHGKPHHYMPEIRRQPPRPRPVSASLDDEPFEQPRDQSPAEVQRRVFKMLKEQGVPVFPTAPLKQVVEQGNAAALGPTRAYIKHLENHRKYDTLNSFRSCDNCALCKQMQKEIRLLENGIPSNQQHHHHQERQRPASYYQPAPDYNKDEEVVVFQPHHHHKKSSGSRSEIISGRLFEPLREVEVEEFPDEPDELADLVVERNTKINGMSSASRAMGERVPYTHKHNLSIETETSHSSASPPEHRRRVIHVPEARIRRDFVAQTQQQLGVQAGERVKVIQTDAVWSLCTTKTGEMGWVPTNNLQFEHSSSLGSSPGSN